MEIHFLMNILYVVTIASLINSTIGAPSNRHNQVDEPKLTSQGKNQDQETFYQKQSPCSDGAQSPEIENQKPKEIRLPTAEQLECPVNKTRLNAGDAASCPWVYYEDYDPDRFPQTIQMVKCKQCDGCLNSDGHEIRTSSMGCREVSHPMKVLIRQPECEDGMSKYHVERIEVDVACSCQRAASISANDQMMVDAGRDHTTMQPKADGPPGL